MSRVYVCQTVSDKDDKGKLLKLARVLDWEDAEFSIREGLLTIGVWCEIEDAVDWANSLEEETGIEFDW